MFYCSMYKWPLTYVLTVTLSCAAGEVEEIPFNLDEEEDSEEEEQAEQKSMIQMQGDNTLRDNFKQLQKGEGRRPNNPPPKADAKANRK